MRQRRQELHTGDLTEDSEGHPANIRPVRQRIKYIRPRDLSFHHSPWGGAHPRAEDMSAARASTPPLQESPTCRNGPVRPTFHLCREARDQVLVRNSPVFKCQLLAYGPSIYRLDLKLVQTAELTVLCGTPRKFQNFKYYQ